MQLPRGSLPLAVTVAMVIGGSGLACGDGTQAVAGSRDSDRPPETRFDEALLHLRVRTALLEHLRTDALKIEIDVIGDTVRLSGEVEERADRTFAEEVARTVHGVNQVENRIRWTGREASSDTPVADAVATTERQLADALLEARVQARLVRELGQLGFQIDVEATGDEVSLRGEVPDRARRKIALDAAGAVPGVAEVHDLLEVAAD